VALQEPYFSDDAGKFLARATGIRVAKISASCADTSAGSYAAHFDALFAIMTGGAAATNP
jgi:hypothetical protein